MEAEQEMLERTYRASRFDEAMAQVKRELGPDAVILSSREIRAPGRRAEVEVRAAPEGLLEGGAPVRRSPALERRLERMGVPGRAVRALTARIRGDDGPEPHGMNDLGPRLCAALRAEMIFAGPHRRGGPRVVSLVGPTGVGKTTTIAKLSAQAALVERREVALVSIDQYRIGGAEQLAHYAELIGIPMETAQDAGTLATALRRLRGADLVLVDTAGRAPRDRPALQEMADTLHGAGEPIEVHLCLAAGTGDPETEAVLDRLSPFRPVKLTMTKLDEAVRAGSIVAAQVMSGLPLAYFTTGQRVPEDIEVAGAERLSALLCGEEVN
jgi:flagellar biosynthesis protein FlhF